MVLFNYAFSVTVPSWLNEKRSDVSVNQVMSDHCLPFLTLHPVLCVSICPNPLSVCLSEPSFSNQPVPSSILSKIDHSVRALFIMHCTLSPRLFPPSLHHSISSNQTIWGAYAVCSVIFVPSFSPNPNTYPYPYPVSVLDDMGCFRCMFRGFRHLWSPSCYCFRATRG